MTGGAARDPASLDFVALLRMGAMILVLGTSVGVMNCFLMSMFPIWQFIWAVLNRPMFLVSGVLSLIDELPDTPGSMRVIFDTMRKHNARIISVLSSYMEDNKRQIYVRIRSMEESAVEALVKDLEATGTLLLAAPYDV